MLDVYFDCSTGQEAVDLLGRRLGGTKHEIRANSLVSEAVAELRKLREEGVRPSSIAYRLRWWLYERLATVPFTQSFYLNGTPATLVGIREVMERDDYDYDDQQYWVVCPICGREFVTYSDCVPICCEVEVHSHTIGTEEWFQERGLTPWETLAAKTQLGVEDGY